ncbi:MULTISPECIES: hypothetical protein [unclassified Alsobacter]|jgi:hypothetical protein|uniref:Lectin-like protein BA14k n=1 Tax=Alsobacter sp. KACC 23698 TaxID=3149229 RepID=A0AAU7JHW1_9HYPH
MKRIGLFLGGLFALFVAFTAVPQAANAAAVNPAAAVQIDRQAPALTEATQYYRRHYYGRPYAYRPRYYRPRYYARPIYRPRVVCRVQYTYYGPRRVCRRW